MTAINVLADQTGAYFLCDGASYDDAGVVKSWSTKCRTLPRIGLGFAVAGTRGNAEILRLQMETMSTYDEAITRLPEILQDVRSSRHFMTDDDDPSQNDMTVLVGGWSPTKNCAEVYKISTCDQARVPAFSMDKAAVMLSLPTSPELMREAGLLSESGKVDWRDPVDWLTKLILIQRTRPWTLPNSYTVGYCVGGTAQLTVINGVGIAQKVILRWPDILGWKIEPTESPAEFVDKPPAPNVDFTGLSRLQRERMQKKISKGTFLR